MNTTTNTSRDPDRGKPWRIKVPWLFMLAALPASVSVEAVMITLLERVASRMPNILQEAVIQFMGLAVILVLFAAIHPIGKLPAKLGIGFPRLRDIGYVVLGLCIIYPWQIASTIYWEKFMRVCNLSGEPYQDLIVECSKASPMHFLTMLAVAGVLIPIVEEVAFRRVLYGLMRPFGSLPAALATAVIFSAVHGFLSGFPALFGLGLVLQWQYVQSKNLLTSIATHMIFNFIALTLTFLLGLN